MEIKLYDTLRGQKVTFEPLNPYDIKMWVCGPTVYDRLHLGNARVPVVFDVLYRLLCLFHPAEHVTYASNITDIDDKIIQRAAQRGIGIRDLTRETTRQYGDDMAALGVLKPYLTPRATDHVSDMISMIVDLIQKGHAYDTMGHVLFHVPSDPNHGRLSRHALDDLLPGHRVALDPAVYKKHPADFVLWKPSPSGSGLPSWPSPWGGGRPGWHIECSAMIAHHLGSTIDIHGGGSDLIFPHHENECSQSECHTGQPLARHWIHAGMVLHDGKKMAKSEGNFVTVRDAMERVPPEAVRLVLLSTHYRQPLDFTWSRLLEAKATLDRFYRAVEGLADVEIAPDPPPPAMLVQKLCDDLNTPEALGLLHMITHHALKAVNNRPNEKERVKRNLLGAGTILGLLTQTPEQWFRGSPDPTGDAMVGRLIDERNAYRAARDWREADRVRDELAAMGVVLEDKAGKTTWRRA